MLGVTHPEGLCSRRGRICALGCSFHLHDQCRRLCITMYYRALIVCFGLADLTCPVLATDPPGVYDVFTTNPTRPLPQGTVFRVNTGGPIPPGADAVIMVEDTVIKSTHKDEQGGDLEEAEIETLVRIPQGENIRLPGSDVKAGDLVFSKDTMLDGLGGDIGTLAFVGKREVCVSCYDH